MDTKEKELQNQSEKGIQLERVFGIILLIPPTIGVFLLILNLLINEPGKIPEMRNLSPEWTGNLGYAQDSGGGGYTSAAPIYFGLMAIAGRLLIKGTDKKQA